MGKKKEKLTTETFIEKSIEIHTNKYDYSNTKFMTSFMCSTSLN